MVRHIHDFEARIDIVKGKPRQRDERIALSLPARWKRNAPPWFGQATGVPRA